MPSSDSGDDFVGVGGPCTIPTSLALMSELSGRSEDILRQICYPDADLILAEFMLDLPLSIRQSVAEARFKAPEPAAASEQPVTAEQAAAWEAEGAENEGVSPELFAA